MLVCVFPQKKNACMNTWNEEPDHARGWARATAASAEGVGLEAEECRTTLKLATVQQAFPFSQPLDHKLPRDTPRSIHHPIPVLTGSHDVLSLIPHFSHYTCSLQKGHFLQLSKYSLACTSLGVVLPPV